MPPKRVKLTEVEPLSEVVSPKKSRYDSESLAARESHVRDELVPPKSISNENFKFMSWNVAGLRGVLKKCPSDVLCLQETKLQSPELDILADKYDSYWSCSQEKKGYAGTVVFVKKSIPNHVTASDSSSGEVDKKKSASKQTKLFQPKPTTENKTNPHVVSTSSVSLESVKYELDDSRFLKEGRIITMDFNSFYLIACYVPNSGQSLERLDYRTNEWDVYMRQYLSNLKSIKPIVYLGDLNVGHLDLDIHNPTAKHIYKQAGLTTRERQGMTALISSVGLVDAFRFLYTEARGHFSYWSQRTFARPVNKGIRLDYFLLSDDMVDAAALAQAREALLPVMSTAGMPLSPVPRKSSSKKTNAKKSDTTTAAAEDSQLEKEEEERGGRGGGDIKGHQGAQAVVARPQHAVPTPGLLDCHMLHDESETQGCSDHCPVLLLLQV